MPLVVNAVEQQTAVRVALTVLKESGSKNRGDARNLTALKGFCRSVDSCRSTSVLYWMRQPVRSSLGLQRLTAGYRVHTASDL